MKHVRVFALRIASPILIFFEPYSAAAGWCEEKFMTSKPKGTGAEYLVRQSGLAKTRQALPPIKDILIVEDEPSDSRRLVATLRSIFGYELDVRRATTLNSALDMVLERQPELILLDDYLKPADTALDSIPMIRHANYQGPIIIISGEVDRLRRAELLAKGANDTINKEDLNSGAITEVLVRLGRSQCQDGGAVG